MSVRAKFRCSAVNEGTIHFHPVYSGSEENRKFYAATPGGDITLVPVNPEAAKQFSVGKEYYVDFTEAPIE